MPGIPEFDCPHCIRGDHEACDRKHEKHGGPRYCGCSQRGHTGALAVEFASRVCQDCKVGDHMACEDRNPSFCDCKKYSLPEHEEACDEEVFVL